MNIIFVSGKMAKAKSLSVAQTVLLLASLLLVPVALTLLFLTPKNSIKQQGVQAMLPKQLKSTIISSQAHLDAYAKEIGELQARIMRLDAQNQRLAKLAGGKDDKVTNSLNHTKPEKQSNSKKIVLENGGLHNPLPTDQSPNSGGPLVNAKPMSEQDLKNAIAKMETDINQRDDLMSSLEAKILQKSVLKEMLPNSSPVNAAYNSSSYGWRIDPFNGNKAFHEGLDFTANTGTPIFAAADGIVVAAERSHDYGNLVKVDHGGGLETRYAHASKLHVRVGDRVSKGQIVAEVGSTGRSTGPHLHYEIRLNGNALDPKKYLSKN